MKCLQCQSERLVHDAQAVDYFEYGLKKPLKLELDSNPDAWLFKGTEAGQIHASVCADCGFVMFSMEKADAEKLYAIQNRRN